MKKKALSCMLAVAMVATLATATSVTSYADEASTRGKIYFDSTDLYSATSDRSKTMYCYTWSSTEGEAYSWDSNGCKMTNEGENLYSYDVPAVNKEGEAINVDLVIFHAKNGKQTWDTTFNDSCIGDTAYVKSDIYETFPLEDPGCIPACGWRNNPSMGAHISITTTGRVLGWSLLDNETPEDVVDKFIADYQQGMLEEKVGYDNPELISDESRTALIARINEIVGALLPEIPDEPPTDPIRPAIDADSIAFEIPESFKVDDNKYYVTLWNAETNESPYDWKSESRLMTVVNESETLALYKIPEGDWDMMHVSNSDEEWTLDTVIDCDNLGKYFTVKENSYGLHSLGGAYEVVWLKNPSAGVQEDYCTTHYEIVFDVQIQIIGNSYAKNESNETLFNDFINLYGRIEPDGRYFWDSTQGARYNMSWEDAKKRVAELLDIEYTTEEATLPATTPSEKPTEKPTVTPTSNATTAPTSATNANTNAGKGTVNTSQSSAVFALLLVFTASLGVVIVADKKRKHSL